MGGLVAGGGGSRLGSGLSRSGLERGRLGKHRGGHGLVDRGRGRERYRTTSARTRDGLKAVGGAVHGCSCTVMGAVCRPPRGPGRCRHSRRHCLSRWRVHARGCRAVVVCRGVTVTPQSVAVGGNQADRAPWWWIEGPSVPREPFVSPSSACVWQRNGGPFSSLTNRVMSWRHFGSVGCWTRQALAMHSLTRL